MMVVKIAIVAVMMSEIAMLRDGDYYCSVIVMVVTAMF